MTTRAAIEPSASPPRRGIDGAAEQPLAASDRALLLLRNLDRLTNIPNAIPKLRNFILHLATMGRLVPQDPKEEPVEKLLNRLADAKRTGPRKTPTREEHADGENTAQPFRIPNNWRWVHLEQIANLVMGQSPPGSTYNTLKEGLPLINGPIEFTLGPFGKTVTNQYTTEPTNICEQGDFLICVRGSTTGRTNVASSRACIGRGVAAIQSLYEDTYVRLFVCSQREALLNLGRGIAFPSISRQQIAALPVPLPPLLEQQRIVAKVDELMRWCDVLEARLTAAQTTATHLLDATLHQILNDAP